LHILLKYKFFNRRTILRYVKKARILSDRFTPHRRKTGDLPAACERRGPAPFSLQTA
jgi:hypothetical protein